MSSKIPPLRIHVAMLNSLRAIQLMGGGHLKVSRMEGQYSRTVTHDDIEPRSRYVRSHIRSLNELILVRWNAKGKGDTPTIDEILLEMEKEGCPELFIKSITVEMPWTEFNDYTLENMSIFKPFVFHPHPFKPSIFNRLKGRMPSFPLYARMKEIRKNVSADLDDETKKRWRDILLINYPHRSLSNQEIRQIWKNETCCILLKESQGKFTFMEVDESREA